jgi:FixJ family two-component response regulator
MTAGACTVHVVDDDAAWRKSVARLLSAAGYRVALYEVAEHFLESANTDEPGCILLDMRMPGLTGLQLQRRLAEARNLLPIIFLSGHGDIPTSVVAMKAGAEDFLTKPVATEILLDAVEHAIARNRSDRSKRAQLDNLRSRLGSLTPTERRVLMLVVRGKLNKQIADELGTAVRTIKWHRRNLMQKLQFNSLAELVSMAERLGLVGARDHPDPDPEFK